MNKADAPGVFAMMKALVLPNFTNWNWITPRLAVGGEPPPSAYAMLHAYGFEATIDLRDPAEAAETVASTAIARLHLPTPDRLPPSPTDLEYALRFIAAQPSSERILIHCVHGIGRSAIVALAALVAQGHTPLEALSMLKNRRWRISPSPEQYEAWAAWLAHHRADSGRDFDIPDFERFAKIAYRHLVRA